MTELIDRLNLRDVNTRNIRSIKGEENLSFKKRISLGKLYGMHTDLHCLRSRNKRHNKVKSSRLPADLFCLEELMILDLSHNRLKEVPTELDKAKSLLVLNLSHNVIDCIPPVLFVQLTDLLFLDLSNNGLETLPPQTRNLANLQTLILNDNPLLLFQLRQVTCLQNLETLHMRNTQRTLTNTPTNLESLSNISDLDLSQNALTKVPKGVYSMINLKRLYLSDNKITELSTAIGMWQNLETLNVSRNKLTVLPNSLCTLQSLRRLCVSDNLLNFEGIPSRIGELGCLEVFSAANNQLEMIPEGLCRCSSLKRLNLSTNRLITLPDAIHLLTDLDELDLRNNPDLMMPSKPQEIQKCSGIELNQLHKSELKKKDSSKDVVARKLRLRREGRREKGATTNQDQMKILKGMQDAPNFPTSLEGIKGHSLKPKRWDEALEKPLLQYSEFFDVAAGQMPGLSLWKIGNCFPNLIEEIAHGKFYEGDYYIVLKSSMDDKGALMREIHFWIGKKATLEKRVYAEVHTVNLRNYLGAGARTILQKQGHESDDFLQLFPCTLTYIEEGRTASGYLGIKDTVAVDPQSRYRIHHKVIENMTFNIRRIYKEVVKSREQQKQMFSSEMEYEEMEKVLNTILSDKIYHRPYILPQLENVIKSDERLQLLVFKVIVNILPTNYAQRGFVLNLKPIMEVINDGVSLENINILVKKDATADLSSVLDWIISKIYDQDNVCPEDVAIVTKIIIEAKNKERYILQIAEMLKIACFMTSDPVIRNDIMKLTRETLSYEKFLEYNVQPIFERLQALNLRGNDFEAISECVSCGYTIDKNLAGYLIQSLGISELADNHNLIGKIILEIDERYNLGDLRDILYDKITGDKDLLKIASLWVVIDNGNKQNITMPENMILGMLDYSSCLDDESLLCPSVIRIIDLIAKTNDIPQAIIDKMMGLVLEDHLSPKIRIYAASIICHKNECSEKIYIEQLKDVANEVDKSDLRYVFLKEMVHKEVKIFIEEVDHSKLALGHMYAHSHLYKDINYNTTLSSYVKNESPLKIFKLLSTINAVVLCGKTINADIFNDFPDDQWRKELLCHAILETMAEESTINEIELYKFVDNVKSLEIYARRYNAEKFSIENILQSFLGKQMKYKLNVSKVNDLLELLQSRESALEIIISSRINFLMDLIEIEEIWIEENLKKYDIEHTKKNIYDLNCHLNCRISIINMFLEKFAQENKIDKLVEFFTQLDKLNFSEAGKEKLLIQMTKDEDIAINDHLVNVLEPTPCGCFDPSLSKYNKSPDDKQLLQLMTEISELNSNEMNNIDLAKEYKNVMDSYANNSVASQNDKAIKDWTSYDVTVWARLIKPQDQHLINFRVSKYEKIAVVKRAIELARGFSPRDTQLLALLCILSNVKGKGILAQINTGEGKTAIVAMLAVIHSLDGRKVDVITTSPTLALPQSKTFKYFFDILNLRSSSDCKDVYADVLYVDSCKMMGEYVRNRAKRNSSLKRKCDIAIVDEVDSMLLDGRNSILQVCSTAPNMDAFGSVLAAIWLQVTNVANCLIEKNASTYFVSHENLIDESGNLREDAYDKASPLNTTRKEFIRTCTEKHLRKMLRDVDNLESADKKDLDLYPEIKIPNHLRKLVTNFRLMRWIDSAISAKYNYVINQDYVIEGKKIIAVDTSDTGVLKYNTKWGGGLHQFLEIKHGAKMHSEDIVSSYISNVSFFKNYEQVYGLTGTLGSKSEREMLRRVYEVSDVIIPPFREKRHQMFMPVIVNSESEWYNMILTSCIDKLHKGRGVLLIVDYIDKTEKIATMLKEKYNFTESKIRIYAKNENLGVIEKELGSGEIIIATNIAGRGADIKPTFDVKKNGGLHVCLTFLPKNQRVEYQNVGRTSRTGNPGSSQLIVLDSDECSIRVLRKLRNEKENKEMNMAEAKMKKMVLQDNLLTEYMEIIVDIEDDDEKAAAYERFGIWLEVHKKIIDIEDEKKFMEKFFIFKNAVLADRRNNSLIQNPSFCVRIGNRLLKDKKYDEAILMYDKAIDLDSDFSGNAYYYRGCALIYKYRDDMGSNREKIKSAVEDFKKARNIVDQRMIELNIIQRASDSEVLGEQVKHKMMFLGILRNAIESSVGVDTDEIERDISKLKLQKNDEGITKEGIEAINKMICDMEMGIKNDTGGIIGDALNKNLSVDTELISIIESIPDEYDNDLCQNEMDESESNGFMGCLKLSKVIPIDWEAVAGLASIGLVQLVAGAVITVFSLGSGSSVGMGLMFEGVSDLITAVKDGIINRDFSWVSWGIQKAISLTVSIACAGMNAIKDAGKTICAGVKQIGSVVTQTTKQGWKLAAKAIGTSLAKGVALEITNDLVSYGLDKTLMPGIQRKIIETIEGPIQQALLENKMVMRMLQLDSKNRNKHYETIIKGEARKILNDKGAKEHPLVQIAHGIGQGILANKQKSLFVASQIIAASVHLKGIAEYVPKFTSKLGSEIEKITSKDKVFTVNEEDEMKQIQTKEYEMKEIGETTYIVEENRSENHLKNHDEIHQNMPEQVTFNTNLELDTGKLANELAGEVSKDISNILRSTIINPVVSHTVNYGMNSLNSILDGCIQDEIGDYKGKRRVIFSQDSHTRHRIPEDHKARGQEATVEAENMISDLSNGGEGGMQHLGAISESIASPIKVIDSEGRVVHIIGKNRKGNPVEIQYHHDGESGHWTLPGNKEPKVCGAGKNDCLFNVIAEQTGRNSCTLRNETADIMMSHIEIVTSQMPDIRRLEKYQKHMLNMGGACYDRKQGVAGAKSIIDASEGNVGHHDCPTKYKKKNPPICPIDPSNCNQNSGHSRGHAPNPNPELYPDLVSVDKYSSSNNPSKPNVKSAFVSQKQQDSFLHAAFCTKEAENSFQLLNSGKNRTDFTVEIGELNLPTNLKTSGQRWVNGKETNELFPILKVNTVIEHRWGQKHNKDAPPQVLTFYPILKDNMDQSHKHRRNL